METLAQDSNQVITQTPVVDAQVVTTQESELVKTTSALTIPSNATELSNGVYVIFTEIPGDKKSEILLKAFAKANLDKKGNLITDNLGPKEQIMLAKNVSDYHTALITWGVELVGTPEDYFDKLGLSGNWLNKLIRSGFIDSDLYDFSDPSEVAFIFLRYAAFNSDKDWQLLSNKLVGG